MYFYTYKITNSVTKHIYIGAHKTKRLNDGYMGSGTILKRAMAKYGADKFEKEILKFHSSQEEMFEHESQLVDQEFIDRDDTYNLKLGGTGGFDYINATMTKEDRQERAERASKVFQEKLKDPVFYEDWYSKMCKGKSRAQTQGH
ncbi:putative site-specific homing DNA endonuclease [Acinetobacter phage Acj61]|jgi:folate-dependent tRNA-U54 methylase TrmFO/GidA|uniref:Putative site-specific homing DNA endonuclease n=1 Tax=Acinetobacter phage Acj61 TaxID=760732 RepID=E5E4C3_9CAUD|nr:homing endonuclease [Acinetobacter phage Acj61]ADG36107.1 putative site-specific homing DNA endonuclease [Acinetobacter phage Acj61]